MSKRVRMTEDILKLMQNPSSVRNIGIIGHIDHGKTTLSDSLLAEAGLLAESLAGEARVLDYLEEEQKRGITMKSANISLYYEHSLKNTEPFLINLVDTPGHLDFTGKVTRALRLIDGVVVIVDCVEEVSSQTETVVRQALEEAARPILFINKIDRLFNELKLDSEQIRIKLSRIIQNFNMLLEMYGDERARTQWLVSAEKGSVIFGSALHRWGFRIPQLAKNKHTFRYFEEKYQNGAGNGLVKEYPIWEAVLSAVVQFLPNPLESQAYRIPAIWKGDLQSSLGQAMLKCDPQGPLVICLSKVQTIKGHLVCTGRIFSGTLEHGKMVYLMTEKSTYPINQVSIFMGSRIEVVKTIPAGNIAAMGGIKYIRSGETIIDPNVIKDAKPFESVKYVSEPVVTVAIEPEMLKDLNKVEEALEEIKIEDPNIKVEISNETGECLVSGLGPLHLETIASAIKERGVNVTASKPMSVFRESVLQHSKYFEGSSPNNLNKISIAISPLEKRTGAYLRTIKSSVLDQENIREKELPKYTELTEAEARAFWNMDEYNNIIISHLFGDSGVKYGSNDQELTEKTSKESAKLQEEQKKIIIEHRDQIIKIINNMCSHGTLAHEPLIGLKITINNMTISPDKDESNYFELSNMVQKAFVEALRDAKPNLFEPIYNLLITTPQEYLGNVTSLLNQYQAKIHNITQDPFRMHIEAQMAVRHSIEFAQDVRSESSGRVFWQAKFDSFQPVPENQQAILLNDIKFRKGLSLFK